ncbi:MULTISPECIES: glutathione S-transferase family protein [Achromobacter]|uniref:GST N-terminal domain-containing protein n=1 Tax=Achromobacter piechaudii TaxID=72556 RepID=A0A6S7DZ08_9BURK|nr:glutathione S-transferase [Achromobacter piechaudii]MPS77597.1 glutathione S-transferase [Achromobacter sp.]CAB3871094.1 hypothetical protein LMG1861_02767 [Achromobacter piechaudii]
MKTYELIGSAGCGSAIVEMALVLANVPHTLTDVPYLKPGPERDRLLRLNPLGQVPTLVTPEGEVMTESAAMILHLHDVAPQAGLAPGADKPERVRFLNLLLRLVAAVYPTFTYGDIPAQWAGEGAAADLLRERVHTRRAELWKELEGQAGTPHMLGRRFSALDLYVTVMTHWRPGSAWFQAECPALTAVAREAAQEPNVARVLRRHFPAPTE